MKKCETCGAQTQDDQLFCSECGSPLANEQQPDATAENQPPNLIHCTNCGQSMASDAPACPACGSPNEAAAELVHCTSCGQSMAADAPVCPACGAPNEALDLQESVAALIPTSSALPANTAGGAAASGAAVKKRKNFAAIIALAVIAVLMAVFLIPSMLESFNPRVKVLRSFERTFSQISKDMDNLIKNVDFLNVLSSTANSSTNTITASAAQNNGGFLSELMNSASAKARVEIDVPQKLLYANAEFMGVMGEVCVSDELAGLRSPILTGEEVLAINTRTLGEDLKKWEPIVRNGLASTVPDISFSLFDKDLLESNVDGLSEYAQIYKSANEALKQVVAEMQVRSDGEESITLDNGKTLKCTKYNVVITKQSQLKALRQIVKAAAATDYGYNVMRISESEVDSYLDIIGEQYLNDLSAQVLIDTSGLVRSVSSTMMLYDGYSFQFFSLGLQLSGADCLLDKASASATTHSGNTLIEYKLENTGSYAAKDGNFSSRTSVSTNYNGRVLNSTGLEIEYRGGRLSVSLPTYDNYYGSYSPAPSGFVCDIDASVGDKKMTATIKNITDPSWRSGAALNLTYTREAGVSHSRSSFFGSSPTMFFKLSSEESEQIMEKLYNAMRLLDFY